MGLSRNISLHDKALLLGRISMILASTWSVHLIPGSDWSSTLVGVWSLSFLMAAEVGVGAVPGECDDFDLSSL